MAPPILDGRPAHARILLQPTPHDGGYSHSGRLPGLGSPQPPPRQPHHPSPPVSVGRRLAGCLVRNPTKATRCTSRPRWARSAWKTSSTGWTPQGRSRPSGHRQRVVSAARSRSPGSRTVNRPGLPSSSRCFFLRHQLRSYGSPDGRHVLRSSARTESTAIVKP